MGLANACHISRRLLKNGRESDTRTRQMWCKHTNRREFNLSQREFRGCACQVSFATESPRTVRHSHLVTIATFSELLLLPTLAGRKRHGCNRHGTLRKQLKTFKLACSGETKHRSSYRTHKKFRQSSLTRSASKGVQVVLPPAAEDSSRPPPASFFHRASSRAGAGLCRCFSTSLATLPRDIQPVAPS